MIRTFLSQAFKIPTGSMENTLLIGDFLLVNKAVYGAQIPGTHYRLPAFEDVKRQDGRGEQDRAQREHRQLPGLGHRGLNVDRAR